MPKHAPWGIKAQLFEERVVKGPYCWDWVGRLNRDGYGVISEKGSTVMAHRRALQLATGQAVPKELVVMHSCDNPRCCNPAHLSIGTHQDNRKDTVSKGRQAIGEKLMSSKLSEEQVLRVRATYRFRVNTYKDLAAEYGVCKDTIRKCVRRVYWRHLP